MSAPSTQKSPQTTPAPSPGSREWDDDQDHAQSDGLLEAVIDKTQQNMELVSSDALGAYVRAEIDVQVSTAKRYPRTLRDFKTKAMAMATLSQEVAASCFYTLPRGKKPIIGPSIRLAEIVQAAWGNIRVSTRLVGDDGKFITAQGSCHDLECNTAATVEIQRRVTDKNGRRFSDDMVGVTGNAAASIARRNAIFAVVPLAYVNEIFLAARKCAIGDLATLAERRVKAVEYFGKIGVPAERVYAALGIKGIEDLGPEQLLALSGIRQAIKDEQTTLEAAFPEGDKPATPAGLPTKRTSLKPEAEKKPEAETKPADETKPAAAETKPAQPETVATKPETKPEPAKLTQEEEDTLILVNEFKADWPEKVDACQKARELTAMKAVLVEAGKWLPAAITAECDAKWQARWKEIGGK